MDTRDLITFVVQKALSVSAGVLGMNRVVGAVPSDPRQAITQVIIGAALLAVAATLEMMVWRATLTGKRGRSVEGGGDQQLEERMLLLERALIERLPRPID